MMRRPIAYGCEKCGSIFLMELGQGSAVGGVSEPACPNKACRKAREAPANRWFAALGLAALSVAGWMAAIATANRWGNGSPWVMGATSAPFAVLLFATPKLWRRWRKLGREPLPEFEVHTALALSFAIFAVVSFAYAIFDLEVARATTLDAQNVLARRASAFVAQAQKVAKGLKALHVQLWLAAASVGLIVLFRGPDRRDLARKVAARRKPLAKAVSIATTALVCVTSFSLVQWRVGDPILERMQGELFRLSPAKVTKAEVRAQLRSLAHRAEIRTGLEQAGRHFVEKQRAADHASDDDKTESWNVAAKPYWRYVADHWPAPAEGATQTVHASAARADPAGRPTSAAASRTPKSDDEEVLMEESATVSNELWKTVAEAKEKEQSIEMEEGGQDLVDAIDRVEFGFAEDITDTLADAFGERLFAEGINACRPWAKACFTKARTFVERVVSAPRPGRPLIVRLARLAKDDADALAAEARAEALPLASATGDIYGYPRSLELARLPAADHHDAHETHDLLDPLDVDALAAAARAEAQSPAHGKGHTRRSPRARELERIFAASRHDALDALGCTRAGAGLVTPQLISRGTIPVTPCEREARNDTIENLRPYPSVERPSYESYPVLRAQPEETHWLPKWARPVEGWVKPLMRLRVP